MFKTENLVFRSIRVGFVYIKKEKLSLLHTHARTRTLSLSLSHLRFDLRPNIRERNPVIKQDPTV